MEEQDFDRYINDRYDDQVKWYSKKASTNKRLYYVYQSVAVVLSVATPLAIALSLNNQDIQWLRWIPLTTSTIVAALTGLQKVFRFQEHWIEYRTTAETLKKERYLHTAKIDEYAASESPDRLFVERVENLISRQNTVWVARTIKTVEDEPGH